VRWRLQVRPEAEADLAEGFHWYERERAGLGIELVEAVEATFELLQENPRLYPVLYREGRRALTRRFPYAVFFVADRGVVTVLAVSHQARDPELWKARL
jgi:plasmid stabilization system protein ParE